MSKKPKTEQERIEAFQNAYKRLSNRYDIDFVSYVECHSRLLRWVINTFYKGIVRGRIALVEKQKDGKRELLEN